MSSISVDNGNNLNKGTYISRSDTSLNTSELPKEGHVNELLKLSLSELKAFVSKNAVVVGVEFEEMLKQKLANEGSKKGRGKAGK